MAEFEDFLVRSRPDLLVRARRLVHGHLDAEDLVQEALLKAWATKRRPKHSWRSWLYVVLRNVVIDWQRRELMPVGERWIPRVESLETVAERMIALDRFGVRSYKPRP